MLRNHFHVEIWSLLLLSSQYALVHAVSMVSPSPALSSNFQDMLSRVKITYSLTEPAASSVTSKILEREMEKNMIVFEAEKKTIEAEKKTILIEAEKKTSEAEKKTILVEAELKVARSELAAEKRVSDAELKLRLQSEESSLTHLVQISAIIANRCLMETALNKWDAKLGVNYQRTMNAQYNDFLHKKIWSGPSNTGSLYLESKGFHDQINSLSAVRASENDVWNELRDLPHTLCSPLHYTTKFTRGTPGCYMGGGLSPFYNALGICIAVLKKEDCCIHETIYLAGENLKPFAKIDDAGIGGDLIPCI